MEITYCVIQSSSSFVSVKRVFHLQSAFNIQSQTGNWNIYKDKKKEDKEWKKEKTQNESNSM
jgi:hypothetical protein